MWLSPSLLQWTSLVLGVYLRQASRREEFRRALSVAVLGYGVTVRVLVLHTLGGGPAFSQAQFEVVFNCHEEVLEGHSCPVEEALQEKLLAGLQAAGDAVLVGFTAAIGQAPITAVLLCAGDADVATAIRQQVLPLADIAQLISEEVFSLDGVPALVAGSAAVA